jgi:hypothetical protein
MPIDCVLTSPQRRGEAPAPLNRAVAQVRLKPRMGVGGGGQAGGKAGGHISRTLGAGQILDPVTQTLRFKTVLAGGGAGVEPQRAGAATARAAGRRTSCLG